MSLTPMMDIENALLGSGLLYKDDNGDWRVGVHGDSIVNEEVDKIIDYLI